MVNSLLAMAIVGLHLTRTPSKLAAAPLAATIPKTLVFHCGVKMESGSLRRVRVSSPLLVRIVLTTKLSTSDTASGPR